MKSGDYHAPNSSADLMQFAGLEAEWSLLGSRAEQSVLQLGTVVAFGLDRSPELSAAAFQTLSFDEQQRAARFHFDRDRSRYIAAHVRLRRSLAVELGVPAGELRFDVGEYGKPGLAAPFSESGVKFNLSHSHGVALLGIAYGLDIGVDIEVLRELEGEAEIAERYFSSSECRSYHSIDAARRNEAFFNCWTRKEAFIKAVGQGLTYPLQDFDVALQPGEPARLLRVRQHSGSDVPWSMAAFNPAEGVSAAVVLEGSGAFKLVAREATAR